MIENLDDAIAEVDFEITKRKVQTSYLEYVKYTNPGYIETRFHKWLTNKIQTFMERDKSNAVDILLLSVPPQHGKSVTITETLPAWWLGLHPERKWIIASYNSDFASSFGRKNRMKCEEYNTKFFKGFQLADSPCNNTEFETTKGGGVYCAGITAGITGHPAQYIIIDDPIKSREEADSETTKDKIWAEYLSSIKTRLKPGSKLIVIQTRWVEDDLFGRLAEQEVGCEVINLPCECDDEEHDPLGRKLGETLTPELGRGQAWLKDFKAVYTSKEGSRAWTALYQGKPVTDGGNLIRSDWWRYYKEDELPALPYIIISVDAAFKDGDDNDFVAISAWGKRDGKYYMLDLIKKHLNFVDTLEAIRFEKSKYPDAIYVLIEDKANGSAIINVLSSEMEGIVPVKPEGGKVSRANAVTPAIERGDVYLPRYAAWVEDFVSECAAFPNGAHDDCVDSMTQALNRMIYVDADVVAEKYIRYTHWLPDMWVDYNNASDELKTELLKLYGFPIEWKDNDG